MSWLTGTDRQWETAASPGRQRCRPDIRDRQFITRRSSEGLATFKNSFRLKVNATFSVRPCLKIPYVFTDRTECRTLPYGQLTRSLARGCCFRQFRFHRNRNRSTFVTEVLRNRLHPPGQDRAVKAHPADSVRHREPDPGSTRAEQFERLRSSTGF